MERLFSVEKSLEVGIATFLNDGEEKSCDYVLFELIFTHFSVILCEHAPIAQLVEQIPLKDKVVGSTPTGRT